MGVKINKKILSLNIISGQECFANEYIDGNPVYVKRIDCGKLANAGVTYTSHGLSNFKVIKINGMADTGDYFIPLVFSAPAQSISTITVGISLTAVEITTGTDRSMWNAIVDIYYIKT